MAGGQGPLMTLLGGQQQQPPQTPMMPQQGGVLPPTNPVQAPPDVDTQLKQQALQQSQMGTQAFGGQLQQNQAMAQKLAELQQANAGMQVPRQGLAQEPWMKMQPMTGQGFGHDVGNVLGDVGKALLLGLSATGPGRAISQAHYGPAQQTYEREYGARAKQIEEIQAQQKAGTEALGAESQMAYRPGMTVARETQAQASIMNAQTRQTAEQHKLQLQTEGNRIREELGKGKLTQEQARTQMMGVIARETNATRTGVANIMGNTRESVEQQQAAEQEMKTESDHWLQQFLGVAPAKPVQTAAGRGGQRSAKAGANVPAGAVVYDSQGKAHKADGTQPLPQGWSTKKQ